MVALDIRMYRAFVFVCFHTVCEGRESSGTSKRAWKVVFDSAFVIRR